MNNVLKLRSPTGLIAASSCAVVQLTALAMDMAGQAAGLLFQPVMTADCTCWHTWPVRPVNGAVTHTAYAVYKECAGGTNYHLCWRAAYRPPSRGCY